MSPSPVREFADLNFRQKGEFVEVKMDGICTFGSVQWISESECGIAFDDALVQSAA
jgi:hypothetical protein